MENRTATISKLDKFTITIDNLQTAMSRLKNILSCISNLFEEDTTVPAFQENVRYFSSKINETSLALTITKKRIIRATDTLLNSPSTGEMGTTEEDRLREENEVLRHRLGEITATNQSHLDKIITLQAILQDKEEKEKEQANIDLDIYYVILRRIEEQVFALS